MTEWYVFSSIVEPRLASNIFGRLVSLVTVCRCSMCNLNHINSTRSISNLVVFGFKCVDSETRMASVNKPPNKKKWSGSMQSISIAHTQSHMDCSRIVFYFIIIFFFRYYTLTIDHFWSRFIVIWHIVSHCNRSPSRDTLVPFNFPLIVSMFVC